MRSLNAHRVEAFWIEAERFKGGWRYLGERHTTAERRASASGAALRPDNKEGDVRVLLPRAAVLGDQLSSILDVDDARLRLSMSAVITS